MKVYELYQEFEANYHAKEQKGNPAKDKLSDDEVENIIDYLNK